MTDQTTEQLVVNTDFETGNFYGYRAALDGLPRAVPLEWRTHASIWLWGYDNGHRDKLRDAHLRRALAWRAWCDGVSPRMAG